MMHGHEKSDPVIVATKPANKAEEPTAARPAGEKHAAESVERRAGTKGNADQRSTRWTQSRISVSENVGSHTATFCRRYPRWVAYPDRFPGSALPLN